MEIFEIGGLKFYVRGEWDSYILRDEFSDCYKIPKDIKTAMDIGAHIGGTTLRMAKMGAEVYAYEPDNENYDLLIKNIELNGLQGKVHAFNYGIGEERERTLYIVKENTGCSSFSDNIERVREREIKQKSKTIPFEKELAKIPYCDFLKFDCEGGEYEFIPQLTQERANKIGAFSGELHFEEHDLIINSLKRFYDVSANPPIDCKASNRIIWATKK